MQTEKIYIIDSARLPIGKYGGALAQATAEELGAVLLEKLMDRNVEIKPFVDEVIIGNIIAGGGNVARKIALLGGLNEETPAFTIDRQCASGLEAFIVARAKLISQDCQLIVCGGAESTSRAPWQIERPKRLYGVPPRMLKRQSLSAGSFGDPDLGIACEILAEKYTISREMQDQYALLSQKRYQSAKVEAIFTEEIIPYEDITEDECPRKETSIEKLKKLAPEFSADGSITAGNCCPLNDGAALSLLASGLFCQQHDIKPEFELVGGVSIGIAPIDFGLGPVVAIQKLMDRFGITMAQIDRLEVNEAFAAQMLTCLAETNWPKEKLNVSGGAISYGHPFGATGAILVRRLMTELKQHESFRYGIAAMCVGGGQGTAVLIKKVIA